MLLFIWLSSVLLVLIVPIQGAVRDIITIIVGERTMAGIVIGITKSAIIKVVTNLTTTILGKMIRLHRVCLLVLYKGIMMFHCCLLLALLLRILILSLQALIYQKGY